MANQGGGIKKILGSRITLFLLLLVFIWLAVNLVNVYYKKYKLNQEVAALQAQIQKAQNDNQQISAMIDYLGSQSFLEKEAKEKLNMKAPGEQVVIVQPSNDSATSSPQVSPELPKVNSADDISKLDLNPSAPTQEESNLAKWWKYFFK